MNACALVLRKANLSWVYGYALSLTDKREGGGGGGGGLLLCNNELRKGGKESGG